MTDRKMYFSFNPPGLKFNEVYTTIKSFYPIGIEKKEGSIYFEYEGLKTLEKLVVDSVHNNENYLHKWEAILRALKTEFTGDIISTTNGQAPSISGMMNLYTHEDEYHRYTKTLHFYISLLGPFYTIHGMDATTIFDEAGKYHPLQEFTVVNAITTSPHSEYASSFNSTRNMLLQIYDSYKFIPYRIYSQYIKGLQVKYLDDEESNIFNALFSQLPLHQTTRGDQLFGIEDWR